MSGFPIPPSHPPPAAHFSAAEFFRDSHWLNVPAHRRADILVEPLYPRLGLLGGASEGGTGKVSKLAALAAARKKKEGEKDKGSPVGTPPAGVTPGTNGSVEPPTEARASPLSLRERLSGNGRPKQESPRLRPLGKASPIPQKQPVPELNKQKDRVEAQLRPPAKEEVVKPEEPKVDIRAPPSTFATIIVGDATRPQMTEPSRLHSNSADLLKLYGEDLTEPFDFAGPSPDDVVANAQSSAKGLAIRRKI